MHLIQIILQPEAAHMTTSALGATKLVQFVDLNPDLNAFQRAYVSEVKRCDELERKLRFLRGEAEKAEVPVATASSSGDEASESSSLLRTSSYSLNSGMQLHMSLDDLDTHLSTLEGNLHTLNENLTILDTASAELEELDALLDATADFFDDNGGGMRVESDAGPSGGLMGGNVAPLLSSHLSSVAGLLPSAQMARFERLLFRATRGNMILRQRATEYPMRDPGTGEDVAKTMFVIFFQGETLQEKVTKICESFGANLYATPESADERIHLRAEVQERLDDLDATIASTKEQIHSSLGNVGESLEEWEALVSREKAVYHEMNKFKSDVSAKALVAHAWTPVWADPTIEQALSEGSSRAGASVSAFFSVVETSAPPPTYFVTNKYTAGFQALIDAYGMASYQEANPGVFALVTFPVLFGIMFGDVGHGIILTLFAGMVVAFEKKIGNAAIPEMARTLFNGRYLILAMGVMSIYAGLLYNDCFGLSLDLFGTNWSRPEDGDAHLLNPDRVYPFGIDPGWAGSTNKLQFYNSFKMKFSIIVAVTQMTLGIFCALSNYLYRKDTLSIMTIIVPELLFLWSLFGYMVFLIIFKWCVVLDDPPLILTVTLDVFLKFGSLPPKDKMFSGQATIQVIIVFVVVVCLPWLLIPKTLIRWLRAKKAKQADQHGDGASASLLGSSSSAISQRRRDRAHESESRSLLDSTPYGAGVGGLDRSDAEYSDLEDSSDSDGYGGGMDALLAGDHGGDGHGGHGGHGGEFVLGEEVVHAVIHTIEFALGTISNTASYLRLWALSLAHAQLAEVIWDQLFFRMLKSGNPVLIFGGFAGFAGATIGVLLIMESLSAFLHALRLHWVETMNKHYEGSGVKFIPFSFDRVVGED